MEYRLAIEYNVHQHRIKVEGTPGLHILSTYVQGLLALADPDRLGLMKSIRLIERPIVNILKGGVFVPAQGTLVNMSHLERVSHVEDPNRPPEILKRYTTVFGNEFIGIPLDLMDNITYTISQKGKLKFFYNDAQRNQIPLDDLQKGLNKFAQVICDKNPPCGHILPPRIIVEQLLVDIANNARRKKEEDKS